MSDYKMRNVRVNITLEELQQILAEHLKRERGLVIKHPEDMQIQAPGHTRGHFGVLHVFNSVDISYSESVE